MKKINKVEIEWMDTTDVSSWMFVEDAIKEFTESKETFKTVGYLIKKTKDFYLVSTSVHLDRDGKTVSRCANMWGIPKGCVKKVKYL